jgi:hypothetical protein
LILLLGRIAATYPSANIAFDVANNATLSISMPIINLPSAAKVIFVSITLYQLPSAIFGKMISLCKKLIALA